MATEFLMPKLGLTMEEGTILEWLVPDGAEVTAGSPVMTIETDKVETEVEASASGRLHQVGAVGDTFACGAVIGSIAGRGRGDSRAARRRRAGRYASAPATASNRVAAVAGPVRARRRNVGGRSRCRRTPGGWPPSCGIDVHRVRGTGPGGRIVSEDVEEAAAAASTAPAAPAPIAARDVPPRPPAMRRVPATAAARQLADLLGVDLAAVAPDPADGYVTRESVARYVRQRACVPAGGRRSVSAPTLAPPGARRRPRCGRSPGCAARSPSACTPRCSRWPS